MFLIQNPASFLANGEVYRGYAFQFELGPRSIIAKNAEIGQLQYLSSCWSLSWAFWILIFCSRISVGSWIIFPCIGSIGRQSCFKRKNSLRTGIFSQFSSLWMRHVIKKNFNTSHLNSFEVLEMQTYLLKVDVELWSNSIPLDFNCKQILHS